MHIITRVETNVTIFCLQFEWKIFVSKILAETIITIFYLKIYEFAYCLFI
jgi:hypothetical protein